MNTLIETQKCPSCKYEHFEGFVDTITEKVVTRGKNAGKVRKVTDTKYQIIGDEYFKRVEVITNIEINSNGLFKEYVYFKVCPKCKTMIADDNP